MAELSARAAQSELDWGIGAYEEIAGQLEPAAHRLVDLAAVGAGDTVVDIGCGTGSVAFETAARGAHVIGVDPAERLLAVARSRAGDSDLEFRSGTATELPLEDGSADVLLSSFGLIFSPDPRGVAAELARVMAPVGRIMFTAWPEAGPLVELSRLASIAVRDAVGPEVSAADASPFRWHDQAVVAELFSPFGLAVTVRGEQLIIEDVSAEVFFERHARFHPLAVSGLAAADRVGIGQTLRRQLLQVLLEANESSTGFRVTCPYDVVSVQHTT